MYLSHLSLTNFKNYSSRRFEFSHQLNFITGENGSGKTNILDAIHYLCLGKSYFHGSDQQAIQFKENFFRIEGKFLNDEALKISCAYQLAGKKELVKNGVTYLRLMDHVGCIPVVMIAPDDHLLIDEGSGERRRFIDNTISQIDHLYLEDLVSYNKVLQQRNAALKHFAMKNSFDASLLETLNEQLIPFGEKIFQKREMYLQKVIPLLEHFYTIISDAKEKVSGKYDSVFHRKDFHSALINSIEKDRQLQRTSEGIHRDEFEFYLDEQAIKKNGSQGQKKSFLLAIKLAQFELIRQEKNQTPVLLLDDLFDKLDETRSMKILHLIGDNSFGQVFITDTHIQHIHHFMEQSKKEHRLFVMRTNEIQLMK